MFEGLIKEINGIKILICTIPNAEQKSINIVAYNITDKNETKIIHSEIHKIHKIIESDYMEECHREFWNSVENKLKEE